MGDHIGAIRNLKYYQTKYVKSRSNRTLILLLAQNLLRASEFKEGHRYLFAINSRCGSRNQSGAAYNIGDAFFERKEYKKAISLYEAAWKQFPKDKETLP